ncbi:hypothetical protein K3495_g4444 [Podosphaera aphanis]|nr:hypothetical protein K3495_g4444 [Podosphaera aphanis]
MLNSLNGYQKRTQDAYINLQWTKHVASICRNKCWPHLPPVDRRGKGKQPEAVMPSEEEMENHRLWFVKKTKKEALRRERAAKEMYQNGGEYQPPECSHSRPDSDSDSGTGGGQEITDEGSQPSERETDAEETSPEVEDASTPRGETSVSGDERSCDFGDASVPCVFPGEGSGEMGDVSVPRVVSEEEPGDLGSASVPCVDPEERLGDSADAPVPCEVEEAGPADLMYCLHFRRQEIFHLKLIFRL